MLSVAGILLIFGLVSRWFLVSLVGVHVTVLVLGLLGGVSGTLVVLVVMEMYLFGEPRDD